MLIVPSLFSTVLITIFYWSCCCCWLLERKGLLLVILVATNQILTITESTSRSFRRLSARTFYCCCCYVSSFILFHKLSFIHSLSLIERWESLFICYIYWRKSKSLNQKYAEVHYQSKHFCVTYCFFRCCCCWYALCRWDGASEAIKLCEVNHIICIV